MTPGTVIGAAGQALALVASPNRELVGIVTLSLCISLTATAIGMLIGAPIGAWLAMKRTPARQGMIVLANGLLGLPPVVVGLLVYLLLSRSGPLGSAGLLFTPSAMVIAQVVLTTPIAIALTHTATEPLWLRYGDAMRVHGATPFRCLRELLIMGQRALLTAFLAAFGRAISEVGAILIVGGNIRGYTRTMTTAITLETSAGNLALALALGLILIVLSLTVSTVAFTLQRLVRDPGT